MIIENKGRINFYDRGIHKGYLEIEEHNSYNYITYFEIFSPYRRQGLGKKFIDEYRDFNRKPLRFSLTSKTSIGYNFWLKYSRGKQIDRIKGLTYEVKEI